MAPRVLMVERDIGSGRQVERDLRSQGFEVLRVQGPDAVETLASHPVDLVLIEFKEATMGNIELCRTIKGAAVLSGDSAPDPAGTVPDAPQPERGRLRLIGFVPVLLLTGEDPASVVRGFEAGADDCIHWPYDLGEMLARVRSMLRIKTLHDELRRTSRELMELSILDGLTGLYNRRYLFEQLAAEVERAVRYQQPLSLLMLDMDEFKPINDRYGHLVGDELFRQAAETFRSIPRRVDVIARYGGDEVAMLLPTSGLDAALSVAHRVCDTMAQRKFAVGDHRISMTVSLGVSCLDPRNPITSDELVCRADVALYSSKRAGGSHVTAWSPELEKK
jgi:two-component system, cell cycle response regulator